jgi:acyl carrier protein
MGFVQPPAELEEELKEMIIEVLVLEDITPGEIDSTDALFVDGLGLDSIDALEIAMAIDERYGITIDADDEENRERFASVRSLASFVAQNRVR